MQSLLYSGPSLHFMLIIPVYPMFHSIWSGNWAIFSLVTQLCLTLCGSMDSVMSNSLRLHALQPTRLLFPWDYRDKNSGVNCHFLLQGVFLTQGLNPGLLHCRQILYCMSHQGSPSSHMGVLNIYFPINLVTQSCLTLWDPMDWNMPAFPVHYQLPELAQTHVHTFGDAFQLSHLLSYPFPPAFNLFQCQGLFQWVSSHEVAKVLELQHQSFQVNIQDWFPLGLTGWISLLSKGLSKVFSSTTAQKHQFFSAQLF